MPLQSGFIVIGTAGSTVDGREIKESWLKEAAEGYDASVYTAVLDLNHWDPRWYGTYGKVLEVKLGKDKEGVATLLANIEPSKSLIGMSREEILFTSMSLDLDFRGKGQCYLKALAVTPTPAAVGTEQLKFASTPKDGTLITGDFSRTDFQFSEADMDAVEDDAKFLSRVKRLFSGEHHTPNTEQELEMTESELDTKLDGRFTSLKTDLAKEMGALFSKHNPKTPPPSELDAAKALLEKQGFSLSKAPDADALKTAEELLKSNGYSVSKVSSEAELLAAQELLKAQGFSFSKETPTGDNVPEGGAAVVTRAEFEVFAQQFKDAKVNAVNFTAGGDNTGGGADHEYV
ncbi:GPO family capsid scaffolding protein [Shewanella sp. D64]|uniref:GPO family capsid scaffolding protein n=1 Tax=unclassified Shewanella TaxID=196818 RepID=UPI0022BA3D54|nr:MULTISPECIES: GPO family capsid scaffolding protein [unclassified Shewanella]MEC4728837.1 GPO family capsid scaffolding protein [Shewanella sp. D64]MEC4740711.1 GPO family capsid scaffolding protein [Shewanella sp. E94]WBJ95330.1 GPO family capsid scaffolding protein [Shewanella sp. MTB7]